MLQLQWEDWAAVPGDQAQYPPPLARDDSSRPERRNSRSPRRQAVIRMDTRSTPKDRMLRALKGEQPGVVPAAPAYPCLFLADFERAFYVEQYRLRMRGLSRYSVDHEEDTHFRAQAVGQSYGVFKARPDWIEVRRGPSRAWAQRTDVVLHDGVLCYEDKVSGVRLPMSD